jgi:protein Mpv17
MDLAQILQFMLFTAIVAAPNYVFQIVLETWFPTRTVPKSLLEQAHANNKKNDEELLRKHGQLDVRNTVIKFFLDQSLSATTNTMLFIVVIGLIKGQSLEYIRGAISTVSNARLYIRSLN